jgi:hypothetical protein
MVGIYNICSATIEAMIAIVIACRVYLCRSFGSCRMALAPFYKNENGGQQ